MIDIANIWKYELRQGASSSPAEGACLFDAGMWLVYGRIGDNPPCSCPIIRAYGIGLNDRMRYDERQMLKPFILRIVGNRDPDAEETRRRFIYLETARKVVPFAFDKKFPDIAERLRALSDDITREELISILAEARKRADSACAAAYSAADSAADSACAAAACAADSAACASASAAASAACAYAAKRKQVWSQTIWILDNVLKIGKQASDFEEAQVRHSVAEFELARQDG